MAKLISILLDALRATWYFIENVTDDDPRRTDKFFELRAQVRTAFAAADCNQTGDPSHGPFRVYAVWGEDDARIAADMQYEKKPKWGKLENDPDCYEFNTEAERDAFIQGAEAAEGWLDWYSMEETEYLACCKARGIELPTEVAAPTPDVAPHAGPADLEEIVEVTNDLIKAAKLVVERWESGNLAEAVQNLQMAASFAEYTVEKAHEAQPQRTTNIAVVIDGGLVQEVITDNPEAFRGVKMVVIDYDTDSLDKDDECLGLVIQGNKDLRNAYMRGVDIDIESIDLQRVADFISDKAYGANQERFAICGQNPCENCKDSNVDDGRCVNDGKCLAWLVYTNYDNKQETK